MKNPSRDELTALRARAAQIAAGLPPLRAGADGLPDPASRDAVASMAQRILRKNRAVGASLILCTQGGQDAVFCHGSARLSPCVPVTQETCFRVASVSKLVMTFGALSLMEDGLLDLDGDISGVLGYPVRHPRFPGTPVTLRMLLTHTAAISDGGPYASRGMETGCTLRELLESPESWLDSAPGTAFHYSNLGAGAAGVLMETVSGMPLHDLMRLRVFDPLGIRAAFDPRRVSPVDDLADGYSVRGILPPMKKYDAAALAARKDEPFDPERDYFTAAGRMITDSRGMAALIRLLAARDDTPVLTRNSLDLMRAPQDGLGGVVSCGRGLNTAFLPGVFPGFSPVGHQGVAYGMCAELFADPDRGCGVGVMTSGVRLVRQPPLMRAGFDLLALGFAALDAAARA